MVDPGPGRDEMLELMPEFVVRSPGPNDLGMRDRSSLFSTTHAPRDHLFLSTLLLRLVQDFDVVVSCNGMQLVADSTGATYTAVSGRRVDAVPDHATRERCAEFGLDPPAPMYYRVDDLVAFLFRDFFRLRVSLIEDPPYPQSLSVDGRQLTSAGRPIEPAFTDFNRLLRHPIAAPDPLRSKLRAGRFDPLQHRNGTDAICPVDGPVRVKIADRYDEATEKTFKLAVCPCCLGLFCTVFYQHGGRVVF